MRGRTGRSTVALLVAVAGLLGVGFQAVPAGATDPVFVNWASMLPSFSDTFDPNAANDCTAGRPTCVDKTLREMQRRFDPLAAGCDRNAIFSLAYLRTTRTYEWARDQVGFFQDTPFVNHEDAVFARYYFSADDAYQSGNRAGVPGAWQVAFDAARDRSVTGTGSLLLGMNAHVNRDLAFVLHDIGLVFPDGTTRKADHDKVNQFLNAVVDPLLAEEAARFDPGLAQYNTPSGAGYTAFFQQLESWREQAWRNAEALADAPTAADRALVAEQIEVTATAQARQIVAENSYIPGVSSAAQQDAFCAAHHDAAAPTPYAFGAA